jgi:hypothetical protein
MTGKSNFARFLVHFCEARRKVDQFLPLALAPARFFQSGNETIQKGSNAGWVCMIFAISLTLRIPNYA